MDSRKFIPGSSKKHGMIKTHEYQSWGSMVTRCTNPKCRYWSHYGGRGIKICDRWLSSFLDFLEDMGKCPEGHSLDRINNDGNYEPSNCRWATRAQQSRNTRQNVMLTFNGKTQCLTDWAEEIGMPFKCLHRRISRLGWSVERALTEPSGDSYTLTWNGKTKMVREWAEETGIARGTISARITQRKWSIEKALTTPVRKHARYKL